MNRGGGGNDFPPAQGYQKSNGPPHFGRAKKEKRDSQGTRPLPFPEFALRARPSIQSRTSTSTAHTCLHGDSCRVKKTVERASAYKSPLSRRVPQSLKEKKKEEMWRGGSCAGKNKHQKRGATRATQFFHPWNHKKKKKKTRLVFKKKCDTREVLTLVSA